MAQGQKSNFGSVFISGGGMISALLAILASGIDGASAQGNEKLSSFRNLSPGPICTVAREVYVPSTQPGVAPVVNAQYLGKGLRRREIRGLQGKSDLAEKMQVRFSDDNGRTWT